MSGVTRHGIRYPDGASKAKNLGPELQTFAEDVDRYIGDNFNINNPAFREAAEEAVDEAVAEVNAVRAYPLDEAQYTGLAGVPMQWQLKGYASPYPEVYSAASESYGITQFDSGARRGDVAVLTSAGKLRESTIPDQYPTLATVTARIAAAIASITPTPSAPVNADRPSLWWARVLKQAAAGVASAFVTVGSSTTEISPGYIVALAALLQEHWYPGVTPTAVQSSRTAEWQSIHTTPGLHFYSAGDGGTNAATYLTEAEMDRIAALDPACISHMIGANDYAGQRHPDTYKADVLAKITYLDSKLTSPCQHVLIQGHQANVRSPETYPIERYRDALREIADSRPDTVFYDTGHDFEAVGIPGADPLGFKQPDGSHLNPDGYRLLTELLRQFFIK